MTGIWAWMKKIPLRWRFKPLLIVVIFFIVIPVFAIGTLQYIEQPGFCAMCHTMSAYYNSWEKSGHSKINCYSCHAEPEIRLDGDNREDKYVLSKYMLTTNRAVRAFGKTIDSVSRYSKVIVNYIDKKKKHLSALYTMFAGNAGRSNEGGVWERCINCHGDFIFSQSGNDHYGHFKHAGSGVITCKQCHGNLVHGRKMEITRQTCLNCHDKEIARPPSHVSASFKTSHGNDYLSQKNCGLCHVQGVKEPLCLDCHKVQMPHPENYRTRHIPAIAEAGARTCFNCHEEKSEQEPADQEQPGGTAPCSICHGREMPHTKNILREHTALVKEQGIKSCFYCHQTSPEQKEMAVACVDCHGLEMPHPPDFKSRHRDTYYAKGQAVCDLCHSPANRVNPGAPWANPGFCFNCHIKNKPHQAGYNIEHQLGGYDRNRCVICHPAVIHCNECHFGE